MDDVTERANILLVDDHPENLVALEAVLSSLDQVLVTAGSGEEALRALLKDDFALILLDAQMPGMDGLAATAAIRSSSDLKVRPDVPIIALTANAMKGVRERLLQAGMTEYLSKPVEPQDLTRKLAHVCRRNGASNH